MLGKLKSEQHKLLLLFCLIFMHSVFIHIVFLQRKKERKKERNHKRQLYENSCFCFIKNLFLFINKSFILKQCQDEAFLRCNNIKRYILRYEYDGKDG